MKKYITLFPSFIYSAFNKTPFRYFFILILRVSLSLIVIHFHIPSAMGDDETSSQELHEGFPTVVNLKQTLNKVHDTIYTLISFKKIDEDTKYELQTLRLELEEKILSENLTVPQVIDFLAERASDKAINSNQRKAVIYTLKKLLKQYSLHDTTKAIQIINSLKEIVSVKKIDPQVRIDAIYLIGELLEKYSLPSEASGILVLFRMEFLLEQINSHIQLALVQSIGKILKKYNLPPSEVTQAFNQIKTGLFNTNPLVRQSANQITEWLLKTDKVSEPEKSKFISWIAGHLNDEERQNKVSALKILTHFIEQDIVSDPNDIQEIAGMTAKLLIHPHHWIVQQKAIKALNIILNKQATALSPDYKKKIARKLPIWLTNQNLNTRTEAIKLSETLFNQIVLPHSEQMDILHVIAQLTFDETGGVRRVSSRMMRNLMTDDNFSLPEKTEITSIVSKGFPNAAHGISKSLNVLKAAEKADVPLDFHILYNVAHIIYLPFPFGTKTEAFVRERFYEMPISNRKEVEQRMLLGLKIDEQVTKRRNPNSSDAGTACEESYSSSEIFIPN